MKTRSKISLVALTFGLFLFSNCNDESDNNNEYEYLIFGTFYGECIGEACVEIFKIENGKLYEDLEDQYPNGGSQETGNYMELSTESYGKVQELYDSIPTLLWDTSDGTIGCPDCSDGGGVYIEIKKKSDTKVWLLDNFLTRIPEEYHEVVNTVQEAVESLN